MWIIKHYQEIDDKRSLVRELVAPSLEEAETFVHKRSGNFKLAQDSLNGLSLENESFYEQGGYYYPCKYIWHVMEIKSIYEVD